MQLNINPWLEIEGNAAPLGSLQVSLYSVIDKSIFSHSTAGRPLLGATVVLLLYRGQLSAGLGTEHGSRDRSSPRIGTTRHPQTRSRTSWNSYCRMNITPAGSSFALLDEDRLAICCDRSTHYVRDRSSVSVPKVRKIVGRSKGDDHGNASRRLGFTHERLVTQEWT
ncbi:hypothetical protein CC78DRAFT_573562 [Lojkania enalia]|uniref:Uncharacterized protein n=1 Tax=Lojkania enalia TaxID=147567 RepID=A0A9P4NDE6_9PLEO|nr:hypothetical protein CC78DRAFT_573562 [Didymosphaeria enalia]